ISLYFSDAVKVPVAQFPIVIQKRHFLPLPGLAHHIRTMDRFRTLEGSLQFRLLQTSEETPKVVEEFRSEITALHRPRNPPRCLRFARRKRNTQDEEPR